MSCGAAPSCQHWQWTSCSGSCKVVLQCLIKSGGIPSLPEIVYDAPQSKVSATEKWEILRDTMHRTALATFGKKDLKDSRLV